MIEIISEWKPLASRRTGRPRIRWLEDVCNDFKVMNINNWKKLGLNRRVWNGVTERVKSQVKLTLILPRSRTGTVWFYTSISNKRAARPKLYTKSLTRDLKLMYSRFKLVRISVKL